MFFSASFCGVRGGSAENFQANEGIYFHLMLRSQRQSCSQWIDAACAQSRVIDRVVCKSCLQAP